MWDEASKGIGAGDGGGEDAEGARRRELVHLLTPLTGKPLWITTAWIKQYYGVSLPIT